MVESSIVLKKPDEIIKPKKEAYLKCYNDGINSFSYFKNNYNVDTPAQVLQKHFKDFDIWQGKEYSCQKHLHFIN